MSIRIMNAVWADGPDDHAGLLVLLAMADIAGDDGKLWPSVATIAAKARMSERNARRVIRILEDDGWLQTDVNRGRNRTSTYRINTDKITGQNNRTNWPGGQNETENRTKRDGKPDIAVSPEPSVTIKEPSEDKRAIAATLEAWASPEAVASFIAYRRKIKGKALTLTAAKRLATHLAAILNSGADPSDALGLAEERGWVSVEAEWYFKEKGKQHGNGNRISATPQGGKRADPALEQIARLAGLGATPRDGRGGVGSAGEEDGSLWLGARPQ